MYNPGQLSDEPGSGWAILDRPGTTPTSALMVSTSPFVHLSPSSTACSSVAQPDRGSVCQPVGQVPSGRRVRRPWWRFCRKSSAEWCEQFEGTDICFAPVLNFSEALEHPHNIARETFLDIDGIKQPAPAQAQRDTSNCGRCSANGCAYRQSVGYWFGARHTKQAN